MAETRGSKIGQLAPEIDLPDGDGKRWRLSDARGRTVALFFYPGDETPVCTKQLCSVRDNWARYRETGAEVIGINIDSVEKHAGFAANHQLPLRLLSDTDGRVVRSYDMKSTIWIKSWTKRGVVVIDKAGYIRYRKVVFPLFRPSDDEVIAAIKKVMAAG
jgi:thioredoxin-dependent peroxiredoxin